jgi:DNA-binding beta-propeller fold protein YncE
LNISDDHSLSRVDAKPMPRRAAPLPPRSWQSGSKARQPPGTGTRHGREASAGSCRSTDAVWVANGSDGTVSRIDPSADAVVETIDLRGSSELAWNPTYAVDADDDSVWIGSGTHHVIRIDPATNEPSAIIDVGRVPVGVALGEEALWVVTIAERALRIEPRTNKATTEVPIGYPVALTAGKQAVWVSDSHGQVWRINPDTGTVTQTTPVGRGLVGLCATDGGVWAASNADGTVVQIDPQDGRVVGLIPVGHAPTDVASSDGTVWVSIQSESAM